MKKCAAAVAAAAAVVALTALSGVALAGDHHGQGQTPESAQNGPASSSDQQAGVKPSNDTKKDQTCTTGGGQGSSATCQSSTYPGKSDSSKRYGNGKTAAQIANGKGAPAGTPVYGPGNSQPHKICGRDVHAYKGGDCQKQTTTTTTTTTTTPAQNENEHGKVYICHATGSATNPYVLIRVSVHAVPAHTRHQDGRDIVLGDTPGPCPTATAATTTTEAATTTTTVATTTTTAATTTTTAAAAATTTTTAAAAAAAATTPPPAANSGVLGASKALPARAAATPSHANGAVLGTLKSLGSTATSGTLPFTGLRLWIFELIALGLIGTGVAMRLVARRRTN